MQYKLKLPLGWQQLDKKAESSPKHLEGESQFSKSMTYRRTWWSSYTGYSALNTGAQVCHFGFPIEFELQMRLGFFYFFFFTYESSSYLSLFDVAFNCVREAKPQN